jgi:osmotically-inducible protein OsmY
MKRDIEVHKDVMEEIKCIPLINANEIGVIVKNGIVTLNGTTDSYPKKVAIERAVKKVKGVKGIAEDIEVNITNSFTKTDSEIAQIVMSTLESQSATQAERLSIFVEDGCVTIEGFLDWDFQRKSVTKVIENIVGVKDIINNIKITQQPIAADIKNKILSSFIRNASVDASKIDVTTEGSKVILSGSVNTWAEYEEAERSAWSTPGVSVIENQLEFEDDF